MEKSQNRIFWRKVGFLTKWLIYTFYILYKKTEKTKKTECFATDGMNIFTEEEQTEKTNPLTPIFLLSLLTKDSLCFWALVCCERLGVRYDDIVEVRRLLHQPELRQDNIETNCLHAVPLGVERRQKIRD